LFAAIQEKCAFNKGECFVCIMEPNSPLERTAEWRVVDIADATSYTAEGRPVIHGKCQYSELEKLQPTEMTTTFLQKMSVIKAD
jgi:hypothetical protein